jgi:AraC-like DNA-binding protein
MPSIVAQPTKVPDLGWLVDVIDARQPLSESNPIWVRHGVVKEGPPTPHPEKHLFCEFGIMLEGEGIHLVEREEAWRRPGDIFLLGPGLPHWGKIKKFPHRFVTIYFLPSLLIELGPNSDGVRMLRRFTAKQSISDRLVRPPRTLLRRFKALFQEIVDEFERDRFGREVKLRTLLMEQLILLLRWEESQGIRIGGEELEADWRPILKALEYLRTHYAEQIYARDLARVAGVSESRLKLLFHQALGLPWVKYLQGYRIHRAAALLHESGHNVTEAALAVGFESLSHFNATFRSFMGVSPKRYSHLGESSES